MPSIDVKVEERSSLNERATNGVDSLKFAKQVGAVNANSATMPCNPYDKCSPIIQEVVPPGSCINPPFKTNGMIYSTSLSTGPIMAPVKSPPEKLESSQKLFEPVKDAPNSGDERQKQKQTASTVKKPKPRSFSLLEMKYNKDKEGVGHGRLVRQRSVKNSYKKETHQLSHAVSAPAAISDALEPCVDDEVFTEEEKTDDRKQGGDDVTNGESQNAPEQKEKECLEDRGHSEPEEEVKTEEDEKSLENKKELIRDEEAMTKVSAEVLEKADEGQETGKIETKKTIEDENVKPKMETIATALDVEALTQDLQATLHLKDSNDKEKDDEVESKEKEVSSLADNFHQSLSLGEKGDKKAVIKEEGGGMGSTQREPPRLRPKGISKETNYRPDNTFTQQQQWRPSQQPSTSNWQIGSQQQQSLPPFQFFLQPQMRPSNQSTQSVVCPPGQSNHTPMVYMSPSGQQMFKVAGQSMQTQHAQHNVYFGNTSQQPQAGYQRNYLHSGGPTAPIIPPQQMNIPGESTGTPSEVDWPPTPDSSVSSDILDFIESESESVQSPMENEEPMTGTFMDIGISSPLSPWDGSQAPSISSISPVPSPYASDHHQSSPAQQVPDLSGPWSPESNLSSHGEPPSPSGSTVIKVTGHMSSGTVTISNVAPHSPCKRQRNDSSTESQEARERITDIKKFLQEKPNTSPSYLSNWPSPPQVQPYSPFLTPPHNPSLTPPYTPAAVSCTAQPFQTQCIRMPTHSAPIYTHQPHITQRGYQQPETPPEGELEAFRKHLAGWSVEELLCQDDDEDTVLHLAICQMKIPLSLAIIERICKHKQCLNVVNKLQQTALYLSVVSNLADLTQILINYGADLFIRNKEGNTPVHAAARNGNNDAIKAICEGIRCCGYSEEIARELFDLTNYEGKTALILAVEMHGTVSAEGEIINCTDTVRHLLQSFASALQPDSNSGKTALHYAVELHKIDLIYILLDYCDDPGRLVNSQMYDGNTALHLIVGRDRPERDILNIVNLLMTRGANVGLENAAREKPLELVHCEHGEIKRRLHGQGNRKR